MQPKRSRRFRSIHCRIVSINRFLNRIVSRHERRCRKSRVNKIGEATFAEVFTATVSGKDVAIKVIPFGEDRSVIVNEEPQSSTANVLHEVTITTRLSALSNRLNLCFARCVRYFFVLFCFLLHDRQCCSLSRRISAATA
jgi:hypothetical protein